MAQSTENHSKGVAVDSKTKESKEVFPNKFIRNDIYPDVKGLFQLSPKSLDDLKESCLFVLDTNVLLFPYTTTSDSLGEIGKVLHMLKEHGRLMIPGQVAREFVSNRPSKLQELHNSLKLKQNPTIFSPFGKYPVLEEEGAYKQIAEIEKEIRDLVKKYTGLISELVKVVESWRWDDPISSLYSNIFTPEIIVELGESLADIEADLKKRQDHKIAPGYKDSSKPDGGIGDLIIWKTILQLAKKSKDIIFVTGDDKADWFYQSQGKGLYERFELVAEFYTASGGGTFRMLKLSEWLKLFDVDSKVVDVVRTEEHVAQVSPESYDFPFLMSASEKNSIIVHIRADDPRGRSFVYHNFDLLIYYRETEQIPVIFLYSEMWLDDDLPGWLVDYLNNFRDAGFRQVLLLSRTSDQTLKTRAAYLYRRLRSFNLPMLLRWGILVNQEYVEMGQFLL